MGKSPAPAGAFVELDVTAIDKGKCVNRINQAIQRAADSFMRYERETGDLTAKASITVKIEIGHMEGSSDTYTVSYGIDSKTPSPKGTVAVFGKEGRLLCQPEGADDDSPHQMRFFDRLGQPIGDGDGQDNSVIGRLSRHAQ